MFCINTSYVLKLLCRKKIVLEFFAKHYNIMSITNIVVFTTSFIVSAGAISGIVIGIFAVVVFAISIIAIIVIALIKCQKNSREKS